jgi:neprilysin
VTAMDMIQSIREAFNELLNENHWMDEQTRIVAKAKADAMKERIGYPEVLTDPDELEKEYTMVSFKCFSCFRICYFNFLFIF